MPRKAIPQDVRRRVLTEAGYRCAVPTCRNILAIDLHHIVEVAEGGENDPSHLLALCPTCHALYTRGVISSESIRAWKVTLITLSEAFDRNSIDDLLFLRSLQPRSLAISGDGVLKFSRLIAAGLAQFTLMMQNGPIILYEVHLSPKGIQLVDAWKSGDRKAFEAALESPTEM